MKFETKMYFQGIGEEQTIIRIVTLQLYGYILSIQFDAQDMHVIAIIIYVG